MDSLYELSSRAIRRLYDARIDTPPVLDMDSYFPEGHRFQREWQAIRGEAMAILDSARPIPRFHDIMPAQADISATDGRDWRMFLLRVYGQDIRSNLAHCPRLAQLLAASPEVLSATLSFLAPHKHIPRHRGPFRGVMRFHLGLKIPSEPGGRPATIMMIDDHEYRISDGEMLLWDDTFPHEVWNDSDQWRIALLLDVRRRQLPPDMALLSRLLIAGIGAVARRRLPAMVAAGRNG